MGFEREREDEVGVYGYGYPLGRMMCFMVGFLDLAIPMVS